MKNKRISQGLNLLLSPVLLAVLGLIFLINPDTAAILIAKILGWVILVCGAVYGVYTFFTWPVKGTFRVIITVLCLGAGLFLLLNPLSLAENIGRLLGLLLAVEGGKNLASAGESKTMALITLGAALILLLAPLTASRLVFSLLGIALLAIGAALLTSRLRRRLQKGEPEDPNIIDAL